jgi:hypothetical protein
MTAVLRKNGQDFEWQNYECNQDDGPEVAEVDSKCGPYDSPGGTLDQQVGITFLDDLESRAAGYVND